MLTGGVLLISFKNFSFVFTTWLSIWLKSPSFHLISVFKMPSSLSWIISSFWFELILPFTWTLRSHCRVTDWPNINIVSQYVRGLEERERDKDWLIDGAVWSHKYLFIKFAILNEYHLQAPKKTQEWHQRSLITGDHNKYNNKEKAWNIARITKMWHKDTKWTNAAGKNGAHTLAQCRVAKNLQFVKKKKKKNM